MNRRAFLSALTATSIGLVLDPERLLWVPGQKTIFLPSQSLFTGRLVLEDRMSGLMHIVQEGLHTLRQNVQMTTILNRKYEEELICPKISAVVRS